MNELTVLQQQSTVPQIIQAGYDSLSVSTQQAYTNDLAGFMKATGKGIEQISMLDIPAYAESLVKAGYRNSTINRKLYSLSKIFNLYRMAGIIKENPITELNKVKKVTRKVTRQVETPISWGDVQAVTAAGNKAAVLVNMLANTGLRISELIGIKHTDIEDFITNRPYKKIRITGKGNKERSIYITLELYQQIRRVFTGPSDYLFCSSTGKPLHRVNLHKQITQAFKKKTGKDIHPHSLRHFFATHKINYEKQDIKAVSKYLGHSGTSITLDMYVDTSLRAEQSMIIT